MVADFGRWLAGGWVRLFFFGGGGDVKPCTKKRSGGGGFFWGLRFGLIIFAFAVGFLEKRKREKKRRENKLQSIRCLLFFFVR